MNVLSIPPANNAGICEPSFRLFQLHRTEHFYRLRKYNYFTARKNRHSYHHTLNKNSRSIFSDGRPHFQANISILPIFYKTMRTHTVLCRRSNSSNQPADHSVLTVSPVYDYSSRSFIPQTLHRIGPGGFDGVITHRGKCNQ
jgi:hypothetical protein